MSLVNTKLESWRMLMAIDSPAITVDEVLEAKEKLERLKESLPNIDEMLQDFGRFLASRIGDHSIVPAGFMNMAQMAIYDLNKGVDGFTGAPIQNSLVGYPPMIYAMMRMYIPTIAKAIFSAEFAAGVQEMHDMIQART